MCGLLSLYLFFEKNNCLYTHTKTKDKNIEGKEDRNEKTKEKRIEVYVTVERTVIDSFILLRKASAFTFPCQRKQDLIYCHITV